MTAGNGGAEQTALWNGFANMASLAGRAVTIVRGAGATVFDAAGRPYLDAIASLWYSNVGHGRPELADAAAAQMRQLAAYQTFEPFSNPPAEALARRVAGLAPVAGAKVFFTPGGGSDAIDTAAKLARAYWRAAGQPGKHVIISRSHAYHGVNAYGTTLGGIPANTEPFGPLVSMVEHVPWDDAEALEKLVEQLGADHVAAFFCEPVIGAGGVYPPPDGYLERVRDICRRRDVLFVADEVITGFGRLGAWLGSGRFALEPDMITTAKGLTSGYAPLGAVIIGPRVAQPFWSEGSGEVFRHGYTYSAHPTACAVGLANLDLIEREQLVDRVAGLEPVLADVLAPLADHELVGEVRAGAGLLAGVEIAEEARAEDPGLAARLVTEIRERGVITRLLRGVALQVSPPFIVTRAELERIAETFAAALDAVARGSAR
ncbi:MAG TPA: aspartate aminotransferase family protein [Streptosporangiaceae bacterium]|jgi:adenosylmethionine-8-amino-7-oxononanoate aminotransferase|nr:aspartate aminotransferase family protein [Streptosporangiaceae bacterium]